MDHKCLAALSAVVLIGTAGCVTAPAASDSATESRPAREIESSPTEIDRSDVLVEAAEFAPQFLPRYPLPMADQLLSSSVSLLPNEGENDRSVESATQLPLAALPAGLMEPEDYLVADNDELSGGPSARGSSLDVGFPAPVDHRELHNARLPEPQLRNRPIPRIADPDLSQRGALLRPQLSDHAASEDDTVAESDAAAQSDTVASQESSETDAAELPLHPVDRLSDPGAQNDAEEADNSGDAPTESTRTQRVGEDQTFAVVLPGRGWVFVGADTPSTGISMISRTSTGDETEFEFRSLANGSYSLRFERQNVSSGSVDRHRELVVQADEEGEEGEDSNGDPFTRPTVAEQRGSPAARSLGIDEAEGLSLDEFGESPGTEALTQIPSDSDAEVDLQSMSDDELIEALGAALGRGSASETATLMGGMIARGLPGDPDTIQRAGELMESEEMDRRAQQAYEHWLSHYAHSIGADAIHFALARLYEKSQSTSDIRRSITHYSHVYEHYPRSTHAPTARGRAQRLQRHFVDVR